MENRIKQLERELAETKKDKTETEAKLKLAEEQWEICRDRIVDIRNTKREVIKNIKHGLHIHIGQLERELDTEKRVVRGQVELIRKQYELLGMIPETKHLRPVPKRPLPRPRSAVMPSKLR